MVCNIFTCSICLCNFWFFFYPNTTKNTTQTHKIAGEEWDKVEGPHKQKKVNRTLQELIAWCN